MILKKPYKFLIKHFKLIHLVIAFLTYSLLRKTQVILNFYNEYDSLSNYVSTKNISKYLFDSSLFIIPIIIALLMIIISYLLSLKDKPKKIYIFNIIAFISFIFINLYTYNVSVTLETKVVDIRIIKAIQNLYLMIYAIEFFDIIFMGSRALGFNVKNFNFNGDDDLNITSSDNEEFELKLEFDSNKTKRNIRKNIRYLMYSYKENKLYINTFVVIAILSLGIYYYVNNTLLNKIYKENQYITVDNFSFMVEDTFMTNYDNDGNLITKNNLIIVKYKIKKLDNLNEKLVTSKIDLFSDNLYFKSTEKYNKYLSDIGNIYKNQIISNDKYDDYIMIFEVPIGFENDLTLRYNYNKNKFKKIKIKPKKFGKNNFDVEANLNEELTIDNNVIKNSILTISSYDVSDQFKIDYNFKAYNNEIYNSYEYIVPDYIDNCDKTILKISGSFNNEKFTLPKFIEKYGKIEYIKDNETNIIETKLRNIKPTRVVDKNYYFSVCNDFVDSEEFNLIFKIRGNIYRFNLSNAR